MPEKDNQELWNEFLIQSAMQGHLSFEIFVHNKGFILVNHRQSQRQSLNWEKICGLWKYYKIFYLKCDTFACNRSLKCSVQASENYPGWKECSKNALCFKCD